MTAGPSLSQGRPVKVAGLAILMGKRMGFGLQELDSVGTAALLKDIGYVLLPEAIADGARAPSQEEARQVRNHPVHGERILKQGSDFAPEVIEAVLQHHENWDGSGYPSRLKGQEISRLAGIVSIADTYYELVSETPDRRALMPHEVIEFVMAFSAERFDPELVQVLTRQIPLYPAGVIAQLNTGERGIISEAGPSTAETAATGSPGSSWSGPVPGSRRAAVFAPSRDSASRRAG